MLVSLSHLKHYAFLPRMDFNEVDNLKFLAVFLSDIFKLEIIEDLCSRAGSTLKFLGE